jgi:hypothetical protein
VKRILYLTFAEGPSGVQESQVVDACSYLASDLGHDVTLVAFLSLRDFVRQRARLRAAGQAPAIVVPMTPQLRTWRLNRPVLGALLRRLQPEVVIARGPFATALARPFRRDGWFSRLVFDARGAYEAELREYRLARHASVEEEVGALEREALEGSDAQLAVSEALVAWWRERHAGAARSAVVIPCTLHRKAVPPAPSAEGVAAARSRLGLDPESVVVAYAGSASGWQSLDLMDAALLPLFERDARLRLLLLAKEVPAGLALARRFPDRVTRAWLAPTEVAVALQAADHGWLVREPSVTNRVASPVKLAEYLAAGLRVLISPELGDATALVARHDAGLVVGGSGLPALDRVPLAEKQRLHGLALACFTKEAHAEAWRRLVG